MGPEFVQGIELVEFGLFKWGAGIAVYHAGVEWHIWAGPTDCSGPVGPVGPVSDLIKKLEAARVVRCDEAPWRFLGLSLAGYNAMISLVLAAIAAWGVTRTLRPAGGQDAYGSSSVSQ